MPSLESHQRHEYKQKNAQKVLPKKRQTNHTPLQSGRMNLGYTGGSLGCGMKLRKKQDCRKVNTDTMPCVSEVHCGKVVCEVHRSGAKWPYRKLLMTPA